MIVIHNVRLASLPLQSEREEVSNLRNIYSFMLLYSNHRTFRYNIRRLKYVHCALFMTFLKDRYHFFKSMGKYHFFFFMTGAKTSS